MNCRVSLSYVLLLAGLCGQGFADTITHPGPLTPEQRVKDLRLEQLGVDPTPMGMVRGLSSKSSWTRASCLDGLGYVGGEKEVPALMEVCRGDELQTRALWRLSSVCDRLPPAKQADVRAFLITTATGVFDRATRNPGDRAAAAATLANVGGPAHPEAILAALKDPAYRWYGLFHLNFVREREVAEGKKSLTDWVSPLKFILNDATAKPYHRDESAMRLVDLGGKAAEDALRAAVSEEKDKALRKRFASSLNRLVLKNKGLPALP